MSILYLDFEKVNNSKDDILCQAELNLTTSIPYNTYNKISLCKMDIDTNNLYCCRANLLQPQQLTDDTQYIAPYDMKDSNNKYIFNTHNGWYKTIFKFVLIYKNGGSLVAEEFPFLYKSEEMDYDQNKIPVRETSPGYYEIDNFNDYFLCKHPFNLLNSFNICLKYAISDRLGITDQQIIELMPKFSTNDTDLVLNNFSYGPENNEQPYNNDILQVQYPEEVDNGTYPGSNHSTPGPMFCFGLNKPASELLYAGSLVSKKYAKDNAIFPSPLSEDYSFLKLDLVMETSLIIPSVSNASTKYNITSQYQKEFYDNILDIKSIVVRSNNIPMPPLFQNKKEKDFLLTSNNNQNLNYYSQDTLFKLSPNWNTLHPRRLIYNNMSITNNYNSLYGLNNTSYNLSIEFIDKFNNSFQAKLGNGQKFYAQLAVFS